MRDSLALIEQHYAPALTEGYAVGLPTGSLTAPLEVDRAYFVYFDPVSGRLRRGWSEGLFGYDAGDGLVRAIDTSLIAGVGGYAPRGTGFLVSLPARWSQGVSWCDERACVAGRGIRLVPRGARGAVGSVVGLRRDKLLYPDAWPGTDLLVGVRGEGIKSHLIVRDDRASPHEFRFALLRPRDATTEVAGDGSAVVRLASGESIAVLPPPIAQDALHRTVRAWYEVTPGSTSDTLILHYAQTVSIGAGLEAPAAYPLDLDPFIYRQNLVSGTSAFGETSGQPGLSTTLNSATFVTATAQNGFTYPAGAFARWRIAGPPAGASWASFTADVFVNVAAQQQYTLTDSTQTIVSLGSTGSFASTSQHVSWTPQGDVRSQVLAASANTPANTSSGAVANIFRNFNDDTDPTIDSFTPASGAIVRSTFTATIAYSDGQSGIADADIKLLKPDGTQVCCERFQQVTTPMSGTYANVPEGTYTLVGTVHDRAGRTATQSNTITVGTTPVLPTIALTSPAGNLLVDDAVQVAGSATSTDLDRIEIRLDAALITTLAPAPTFTHTINLTATTEGTHSISATAVDTAGQTATATATVRVDHLPPIVALTTPAPGATVQGTISIEATATDTPAGVESVTFTANDTSISTDQTTPYSTSIDTTIYPDGNLDLAAIARDTLNHQATSAHVTINIDNIQISPPASVLDGPAQDQVWTNTASTLTANWPAVTGATDYELCITTAPSPQPQCNVADWISTGRQTVATASGLVLAHGTTYHACVRTVAATERSPANCSNGQTADLVAPPAPAAIRDGLGTDIDLDLTSSSHQLDANWDAVVDDLSGVAAYEYCAGRLQAPCETPGWTRNELIPDAITLSLEMQLELGTTYYVCARTADRAGNTSPGQTCSDGQAVRGATQEISADQESRNQLGLANDPSLVTSLYVSPPASGTNEDFGFVATKQEAAGLHRRFEAIDLIEDTGHQYADAQPAFAGLWVDQLKHGQVTLAFTRVIGHHRKALKQRISDAAAGNAQLRTDALARLRVPQARFSQTTLQSVLDRLDAGWNDLRTRGITLQRAGIDAKLNRVVAQTLAGNIQLPSGGTLEHYLNKRFGPGIVVQAGEPAVPTPPVFKSNGTSALASGIASVGFGDAPDVSYPQLYDGLDSPFTMMGPSECYSSLGYAPIAKALETLDATLITE